MSANPKALAMRSASFWQALGSTHLRARRKRTMSMWFFSQARQRAAFASAEGSTPFASMRTRTVSSFPSMQAERNGERLAGLATKQRNQ